MANENQHLELYKMAVTSALDLSTQKQSRNRLYLTMITALVAVFGIAGKMGNGVLFPVMTVSFVLAAILCHNWTLHLRAYQDLMRTKFEIIHEMEEQLDYAFFTRESQISEAQKRPFLTTTLEIKLANTLKYTFIIGVFVLPLVFFIFCD